MKREFYSIRESLIILVPVGLATLIFFAVGFWITAAIGAAVFLFVVYFFRDPRRSVVPAAGNIVSPADGTVLGVSETDESRFIKSRCQKVSIFLSIFDVHVNRAPISGKVKYLQHQPGRFLNALREAAAAQNESNFVGIENGSARILVRQIAGAIARRIVCRCEMDDLLEQGQKFGMIKFGSRVEVYLPMECRVLVHKGEKVKAGLTLLGEYDAKSQHPS